jgi:hypothetical protein
VAVRSGGEFERVVAVEVDVLVRERGDVLDLAGGDHLVGGAEFVEDGRFSWPESSRADRRITRGDSCPRS